MDSLSGHLNKNFYHYYHIILFIKTLRIILEMGPDPTRPELTFDPQ